MTLSMTFTAPPVLATGVVEEPSGTTIEVDGLTGTFVVTLPASSPIVQPLAITWGIVLLAGILIIWLRRSRTGGNE